jgi:hypothetical protein
VTSILPTAGSTTGTSGIIITGAEFAGDATVTVGGITATTVVLQGSTALSATVGPRPTAGLADVSVTSGGRTATLPNAFTFIAPSGTNQPPVVTGIRSVGSRTGQPSGFGDVDETVTLIVTATDSETSPSTLSYQWSGQGTFVGSGPSASWKLPGGISPTPAPVTATVAITETYAEGSVTHRNVTLAQFVMQIHDSQKEVMDIGEDFLTLFSRSDVSSTDVLHNFSTTCDGGRGREDEKGDVDANRAALVEDFSKFRITRNPPVAFNFGGRCPFRFRPADACASFTVHWEATYKKADAFHKVGDHETTDGTDFVTAVLENNRWRLCHSDFSGTATNPLTGFTRFVQW